MEKDIIHEIGSLEFFRAHLHEDEVDEKTSDAIEILNRTFGNDPERRRAIDKEREQLEDADWMDASLGPYKDNAPDLQQLTPIQIADYCAKVLNHHLSSRPEGKLLFQGVQIIKQLQAEA